uniref:Large ribosomal subunit protein eL28 n=1 Tax=Panagrolaimus superbus TaxID=310955 RepID=A0A914YY15_9BILA
MVYKNSSKDLVWQVIRNNHAYIRKQRGINKKFSTEKFNLRGINSPRFNGFTNSNGIDVSVNADKQLVVSTKNQGKANFPAKSTTTHNVRATRRAIKTIGNTAKSTRTYLQKAAQLRTSQLLRSLKPSKPRGAHTAAAKTEA